MGELGETGRKMDAKYLLKASAFPIFFPFSLLY